MITENGGPPCALITGASAGIGEAFAIRLARDGYNLIINARRHERLQSLAQQLRGGQDVEVEVLVADLTDPAQLRAVEERVAGEQTLRLLVNNAGFGGYMPFVNLDPDRAEELIRLHVVALTRLTRAALPGMVERGGGAIINVSSLLSFTATMPAPPLPFRATYAACKAYINTFTQLVQNEVAGTGVQLQVLCPGLVRTEFHDLMGRDISRLPRPPMEPDVLVEGSLAGLRMDEVVCIPTLEDPSLLARQQELQRQVFEHSGSGALSPHYSAEVSQKTRS